MTNRARRYFRTIWVLLSAAFGGGPAWVIGSFFLQLVSGVGFAIIPYFTRSFANALYYHHAHELEVAVIFFAIAFTLGWGTAQMANISASIIAQRSDMYVSLRIGELVNEMPGIEQFERSEYLRELDLLSENRRLISQAPQQMLVLTLQVVCAGVITALLASVHVYFVALPFMSLFALLADNYSVRFRQRIDDELAETRRLSTELFDLSSSAGPAKELRVFGLTDEVMERHDTLSGRNIAGIRRAGLVAIAVGSVGWVLFAASFVAAVVDVVVGTVHSHGSPGSVVEVVLLILSFQFRMNFAAPLAGALTRARRAAGRFVWLEDQAREQRGASEAAEQIPDRITAGIEFDRVTFRYPGTDVDVIRDVSLRLPAGSAVAIVGENGAGKTTIVKLLSRMYVGLDPCRRCRSVCLRGSGLAGTYRRHVPRLRQV